MPGPDAGPAMACHHAAHRPVTTATGAQPLAHRTEAKLRCERRPGRAVDTRDDGAQLTVLQPSSDHRRAEVGREQLRSSGQAAAGGQHHAQLLVGPAHQPMVAPIGENRPR